MNLPRTIGAKVNHDLTTTEPTFQDGQQPKQPGCRLRLVLLVS